MQLEAQFENTAKSLVEKIQWLHDGGHGAFVVPMDGKFAVVDSSAGSAFLVGEGETYTNKETTLRVESRVLKTIKKNVLVYLYGTEIGVKKKAKNVIESFQRDHAHTTVQTRAYEGLRG